MTFDLGLLMAQKQERECARLDDFDFRLRARTIRRVAAWVSEQAQYPAAIDPFRYASEIATREFEAILADLRTKLRHPTDDPAWRCVVDRARQEARKSLIDEFGDPTPVRLG